MQSRQSTTQMLSKLNEPDKNTIEWFWDGVGVHFRVCGHDEFITFRLTNGLHNLNWAGALLSSSFILSTFPVVETMRYYSMHPSRWIKLFFSAEGTRYQYEGPNVGVYKDIVDKLEGGICGVDPLIPGYSSFDYHPPMQEGDLIAPSNTFGVANIFREIGRAINPAFENCLIENCHLQNTMEEEFIKNESWFEKYLMSILFVFGMLAVGYRILIALNKPDYSLRQPLSSSRITEVSNQLILEINVVPMQGKSFEQRLLDIDEHELYLVPKEFCCSLSLNIMNQPVVLNSGHSFDFASLTRWLEEKGEGATCPASRKVITCVSDNLELRKLIDNYVCSREVLAARKNEAAEPSVMRLGNG